MSKRRSHALSRQYAKTKKEEERKEKTALPLRRERDGVVVAPP